MPEPLNPGAIQETAADTIRKNLLPAYKGKPGWDALVEALAAGDSIVADNNKKAFDQLFLSTASGIYLQRKANDVGVVEPSNVGMSDDIFRQLAIKFTSKKLVSEALLEILEVFYGANSTRANISSAVEPFVLADGQTASFLIDDRTSVQVIFNAADFSTISAATAPEVAAVLSRSFRAAGVDAYAVWFFDEDGNRRVRVYSGALGLLGSLRVTGGLAQNALQFSTLIAGLLTSEPSVSSITIQTAQTAQTVQTTVTRFLPKFWTCNFSSTMVGSLVTTSPNSLKAVFESRTKGDLGAIEWWSKDNFNHPAHAYEEKKDYRTTVLSFHWKSTNMLALDQVNAPTLAIEGRDSFGAPVTYYVRLSNYITSGSTTDCDITLDFSTVMGGWDGLDVIYLGDVDRMFISVTSTSFTAPGDTTPLAPVITSTAEITNIVVSGAGANMTLGDAQFPQHNIRISSDYDDTYNRTPEAIIRGMIKGGATGWIDWYLGATHYYSVTYTGGRWDIDTGKPALNDAASAWHADFFERLASAGMGIVFAMSLEIFNSNIPLAWAQKDSTGAYAATGYIPPTYLISPCSTDGLDYVASVFNYCATMMESAGVQVQLQFGEWWWWLNGGTKPCFYDTNTTDAYTAEMGGSLPVYPTIVGSTGTEPGLTWLASKLGNAVTYVRDQIRAVHPAAKFFLLIFPPGFIIDGAPMAHTVNLPTEWAFPCADVIQLEDYDWVTGGQFAKSLLYTKAIPAQLGYTWDRVHYLAGFAVNNTMWPDIQTALRTWAGFSPPPAELMLWSEVQVERDAAKVLVPDALQWNVSKVSTGVYRFTYAGYAGASVSVPDLTKLIAGDYVNLYFPNDANLRGSFPIVDVHVDVDPTTGSYINHLWFDISSSTDLGILGLITAQASHLNEMMFFRPTRFTVASLNLPSFIAQHQGRGMDILLPATTQAVNRTAKSGAYLHTNDPIAIATTARGAGLVLVTTVDQHDLASGQVVSLDDVAGTTAGRWNLFGEITVLSPTTFTMVDSYNQDGNGTGGTVEVYRAPSTDGIPGPYLLDPDSGVTVAGVETTTSLSFAKGRGYSTLQVASTADFPNEAGYLVAGLGTTYETAPIPYLGVLDSHNLILDRNYVFPNAIPSGAYVSLLASKGPWAPNNANELGCFYVTDSPAGRVAASAFLDDTMAVGVQSRKIIVYPGDRGLGGEGLGVTGQKISDKVAVWAGSDVDAEVAAAHE